MLLNKSNFLKLLLITLFFAFVFTLNGARAENASDYVLRTDIIPSDWKIVSQKSGWNLGWSPAAQSDYGFIERCKQTIVTDKNEKITVIADLYKTSDGARRYLYEYEMPFFGISPDNMDPNTRLDIGDGGYRSYGSGRFTYTFRKSNVVFYVNSKNEELVKEAVSLLMGEKKQKPIKPIKPIPLGRVGNVAKKVAAGAGGAAGVAAILYGLFHFLKFMTHSFGKGLATAATTPRVTIKKPKGPSVKIKELAEEKPKEKKEEKKKPQIARIDIISDKTTIKADGKDKTHLAFKVFDSEGKPLPGETIRFQLAKDWHKLPETVVTDFKGEIHLDYIASNKEQSQLIVAHSVSNPAITQAIQIEETKPRLQELSLQSVPPEVTADGKSTSQIKIFAGDSTRRPATGETIKLWFETNTGSKIEPDQVVTNANGEAQAKFTAGKYPGEQDLCAMAQSNRNIQASVNIKLKEEICYEAIDNWTSFRVRVNIPHEGINIVRPIDILGAKVLDNSGNEIKTGYSPDLLNLAAFIGHYGTSNNLSYTQSAARWRNVFSKCTRIVSELESALDIGVGVGVMTFTSAITLMIAEEFGGKLISLSAKVLGKSEDKAESKIGLEKQDQVYTLIKKEKAYMSQMAQIAGELADLWSQVNHTGGSSEAARKLFFNNLEAEFYELNTKILINAIQKGKITNSLNQSEFNALNKDIESINQTILETKNRSHEMQVLREKINSFII